MVVAFVDSRCNDSGLCMRDFSDWSSIPERTVQRALKAQGTSWLGILTGTRIRRAHELVVRSNKSISDIMYEVGYLTPSVFTNNYRRFYGETPSKTRKKARSGNR